MSGAFGVWGPVAGGCMGKGVLVGIGGRVDGSVLCADLGGIGNWGGNKAHVYDVNGFSSKGGVLLLCCAGFKVFDYGYWGYWGQGVGCERGFCGKGWVVSSF